MAAENSWEFHHLDVNSAFQNGTLYEDVYVNQPEGYVKEGKERKVYRLFKALHMKKEGNESLIIGIYVDDLTITGANVRNIIKFKVQVGKELKHYKLK